MKRMLTLATTLLLVVALLASCGGTPATSPADTGTSEDSTTPADTVTQTTIRFYGSDGEYNQNIVAGFEAANPDVKVEIVPIDFDNAEQVIKTGISSGSPVDVSFFWGTNINTFVDNNMAYDFTDALDANGGAWRDTFVPVYLDGGKVNDRIYAISYQPVIETLYYNVDIFNEYSIEVPTTWDEYMAVCEMLKGHGIYGMGNWSGQNHQLLAYAYQEMANNGVLEDATAGNLPLAGDEEAPGVRRALEMIQYAYEQGYWYPGEGALTATKDQVQAGFYQGKIATLYDAGSNIGTYQSDAPFEVGVMKFPLVEEGGSYGVNVVTNALFIPDNAANKDEALRFIQYYTSDEAMQHIINSGRLPSTVSMQDKVENELMRDLLKTTDGDNVVGYQHLQNLSPELASFIQNDLIGLVCSGTSIDNALAQLESLRQTTVK